MKWLNQSKNIYTVYRTHLSVKGVITRRGVLPRYSYEYRNCASQMLAKQWLDASSHLWRNWLSQANACADSTLLLISLATTSRACTSMVHIVMIFCLSPLVSSPISKLIKVVNWATWRRWKERETLSACERSKTNKSSYSYTHLPPPLRGSIFATVGVWMRNMICNILKWLPV